jgi:hypothetical protein
MADRLHSYARSIADALPEVNETPKPGAALSSA